MFYIQLNESIRSALQNAKEEDIAQSQRDEIDTILSVGHLSMDNLIDHYEWYLKGKIPLKTLISPIEFKFKAKHVPGSQYSPEFKKDLERLGLQQRENEYQELIKKSRLRDSPFGSSGKNDDPTPAQMAKEIREQMTTVFNVLVSVVSVVFAIWYWSGSSTRLPLHYRVILCLFFGILVLVAEVVVYNSYLRKISDAKSKERSKKEKKKVVKQIII
ncbi:hypothetical protein HG536_0A03840 [Torulaspora globosa]|uniref:Vacuolar ATPase assembly integral membrane protein VPH2 n=1 Tax=Torulaspora globosa TaxID=48254 RepID=A0A7G3ZAN0_9SACH|nr:uncharacterized protein HG536_0A03840 [Torulaspora globosa]QLL30566.1 hypothetical protein HG536_0A03840 [Torulaspora globosa]